MSQTVVVFGATGLIGASVATALLNHFKVKGVTRDLSNPKAQGLSSTGVELVEIKDSNPEALNIVVRGAYSCFVMTHTDLSDPHAEQAELRQGKAIAEACQRNGVQHVVYSTQLSVVNSIGLRVRHMDCKAQVEQYMKDLGLSVTGIIIPCLYESLLETPFRPRQLSDGTYGLGMDILCTFYPLLLDIYVIYFLIASDFVSLFSRIYQLNNHLLNICHNSPFPS